jgi:hypothetical protein
MYYITYQHNNIQNHKRNAQLCNTVSVQKHYCQLYNSQCKNTSIICATVNTRTLLSAVQHSVSTRTLCQLCKCPCKNTTVSCTKQCQLYKCPCKNTTVSCVTQSQCKNITFSCATVSARTLPSAVQVLLQEHYCQLYNSVSARTLMSGVQVSM